MGSGRSIKFPFETYPRPTLRQAGRLGVLGLLAARTAFSSRAEQAQPLLNAVSMKPDGADVVVRLPIRVRRTEYGQGESTEVCSVACPIAGGDVPLTKCADCERAQAVLGERGERVLECRVPASITQKQSPPAADLHEKLQRTKVSEVMTRSVTCVDSELDLAELSKLLQTLGLRGVPVVEDQGVILGMVSLTDLVRGSREESKGDPYPPDWAGLLVEDIMSGEVVTLRETSSVAEAMVLMSKNKLHRVAVVAHNDVVVGILSLVDLARWVAREGASP